MLILTNLINICSVTGGTRCGLVFKSNDFKCFVCLSASAHLIWLKGWVTGTYRTWKQGNEIIPLNQSSMPGIRQRWFYKHLQSAVAGMQEDPACWFFSNLLKKPFQAEHPRDETTMLYNPSDLRLSECSFEQSLTVKHNTTSHHKWKVISLSGQHELTGVNRYVV